MLTRDILDEIMPDTDRLFAVASRISGVGLPETAAAYDVGLLWMQDFIEKDRFHRPPWKDTRKPDGSMWADNTWQITARGLEYKNSSEYLTAEGWPTGTTCWYVCVECGWREFVAAERPIAALLRGIIVMVCTHKWREIAPDIRPRILDIIKAEMAY